VVCHSQPRLSVHDLASVIFGRSRGWLLLLKAYLDETNSNKQGKFCVVAGFLGSEQQWDDLTREWQSMLDRKHRKPLHMNSLRWGDSDRQLLAALAPLPDKYNLTRIMGAIANEDYRDCVEGKIVDYVAVPYLLAMQVCIAHVLLHLGEGEEVAFIFEEHSVYKHSAQTIYNSIFAFHEGDARLHSLTHVRKNTYVAMQTADYLAFQLGQFLLDPASKKSKWGMSILGDGNVKGVQFNREQIKRIVQTCISKGISLGSTGR